MLAAHTRAACPVARPVAGHRADRMEAAARLGMVRHTAAGYSPVAGRRAAARRTARPAPAGCSVVLHPAVGHRADRTGVAARRVANRVARPAADHTAADRAGSASPRFPDCSRALSLRHRRAIIPHTVSRHSIVYSRTYARHLRQRRHRLWRGGGRHRYTERRRAGAPYRINADQQRARHPPSARQRPPSSTSSRSRRSNGCLAASSTRCKTRWR